MKTVYEQEDQIRKDPDTRLISRILEGDAQALETLMLRHQAWIYNIAFKMIMDHEDAKDITQEILIRIMTSLASYNPAKGAFRTWLYRIVVNHTLNMRKKKFEVRIHDFDTYVSLIEKLPDNHAASHPETALLAEELKTGCMMGMLLCLKRIDRMVFLLGAVFGLRDEEGTIIMEISRENFRQKLSRSRRKVAGYMEGICGHVNPENPCRCTNKVKAFADMGMLDAKQLRYHRPEGMRVQDMLGQRILRFEEAYYEPFIRHFREQPFYAVPDRIGWMQDLFSHGEFKEMFHLNGGNPEGGH